MLKLILTTSCFLFAIYHTTLAEVHDPRALMANPITATSSIAPKLDGLGNYDFKVTTSSKESQYFFNQGYRLTAAFNHSEALRAFKEAVRLDQNNAMAYWGWALVLGPNLNLPMQDKVKLQAYNAIQSAVSLKDNVSKRERAYIDALAKRYSNDPKVKRSDLDIAYADAMKDLVKAYPDDLDAATLYAAALMNTNPWDYWYRDGTPKLHTKLIMKTLQSVIKRNPKHAAAHHYLIHTVEAFRPKLGVDSADILGSLMPGAGHLVHMPSHIYMRVGRYADAYKANVKASAADEKYITQCRTQGMYPLTYYPHNLHFMVWSSMFLGRSAEALDAARRTAAAIPENEAANIWAINETFRSQPMFVLVRFGQWDAMLAEPQPKEIHRFMNAVWHYGRGLAYANKNKLTAARMELDILNNIRIKAEADGAYYLGFSAGNSLLTIAELILKGEIQAKMGNSDLAVSYLDRAVRIEDSLRYNEPPDWYFPVRHVLGAILLESGKANEAEVVYWEDLRRNPENGFALHGLHQSIKSQGDNAVATVIKARLNNAWKEADVELKTSRY
ncbi:MAG: hypothetical protein COA74_12645 [Gammaproteobacteria bacterium]|nr:MAG: hypothetical protein COA74_12645 [Gammaproteobacteria bacterium]